MINQQTQTLLDAFTQMPLFSQHKAILIGGTALAYHLSHRESFDLDICSLLLLDRNKIRDLYDIVYLMKECDFTGKNFIDTVMEYRITYLPKHIFQLIEAKEEDVFDIEGIENPSMDIVKYQSLKAFLLDKIRDITH